MRYTSAFVLAAAALASAQSSSSAAAQASSSASSSSTSGGDFGCGSNIDQILSSCLDTKQPLVKDCKSSDYSCQCEASQQVDACYN